jgi:hypothetical protein
LSHGRPITFFPEYFFSNRTHHPQKGKTERHFSRTGATSQRRIPRWHQLLMRDELHRAEIESEGRAGRCPLGKAAAGSECLCQAKNASTADGSRAARSIECARASHPPESEVTHRFYE